MKKFFALLLVGVMLLSMCACSKAPDSIDLEKATWDEIVKAAEGTTVTFYGWGGDENRNNWLNNTVAAQLKEKYDITLEVVGMDINDILAKLS
ncbi:MAG: ABC transporter substrate-binding protein, partial [Clostridia bacterium]|nr:ABC transporter substrate-binding protein [Clostridia bacterium]